MSTFQTEFPFELPKGYIDSDGVVHKKGLMRLATAADEILPMKDPRVQQNAGYISIILLSRVIVKLGDLPAISTNTIEKLFTADLAYLQDLYTNINQIEPPVIKTVCPHCHEKIEVPYPLGE